MSALVCLLPVVNAMSFVKVASQDQKQAVLEEKLMLSRSFIVRLKDSDEDQLSSERSEPCTDPGYISEVYL